MDHSPVTAHGAVFPPETPNACLRCLAPASYLIDHHRQVQLYSGILRKRRLYGLDKYHYLEYLDEYSQFSVVTSKNVKIVFYDPS